MLLNYLTICQTESIVYLPALCVVSCLWDTWWPSPVLVRPYECSESRDACVRVKEALEKPE